MKRRVTYTTAPWLKVPEEGAEDGGGDEGGNYLLDEDGDRIVDEDGSPLTDGEE